jgi:hypothetical protein
MTAGVPRRGGHARDVERGDVGFGVAAQVSDMPLDQERLGGVREDAAGGGQDLDGADLVPAVPAVFHHVLDGDSGPGQVSCGTGAISSNLGGTTITWLYQPIHAWMITRRSDACPGGQIPGTAEPHAEAVTDAPY